MNATKYPLYYRLRGRCIKRKSDTNGLEVRTPDNIGDTFPLGMSEVTYPDKAHFDKAISNMEEVDEECYYAYVSNFLGNVETKINAPMNERAIKRGASGQYQGVRKVRRKILRLINSAFRQ